MTTEIAVSIFGREVAITAEQMTAAATTLTLLTCMESMTDRDRKALTRACEIVRDLGTRPGQVTP